MPRCLLACWVGRLTPGLSSFVKNITCGRKKTRLRLYHLVVFSTHSSTHTPLGKWGIKNQLKPVTVKSTLESNIHHSTTFIQPYRQSKMWNTAWVCLLIRFPYLVQSHKSEKTSQSEKEKVRHTGLGTGFRAKYFERISSEARQLLGSVWKRTPQNKWSTYCWKMSSRSQPIPKFQNLLHHSARSFQVSCLRFIAQQGILRTFYEIQHGDFAVINSTHAWRIEACKMFNIPVHRYFRDKIRLWIIGHNK